MNPVRCLTGLIILVLSAALRADAPIYADLYTQETGHHIVFGNGRMALTVDKRTGEWISWTAGPLPGNLLTPDNAHPALDVSVDSTYLVAGYGATFLRKEVAIDADHRGCVLSITVGMLPQETGYAYELTSSYRLFPMSQRIERWARLVRHKPGLPQHVDGFRFQLPGVVIGPQAQNTLTIPGPFFTKTFVAPDTPYDLLKTRVINFHSAPDAGFGLLLLTNKDHKTTLSSWMSTRGEVAYATSIQGNGRTITVRHDDKRAYYLQPQMAVESDTQHVELTESAAAARQGYRRVISATMPLDTATPAWVKNQVILEVYPAYYKGGLAELTTRLPFYKSIGFTMIYLMPHWEGGYSPVDPFRLDSACGSPADLKAMVKTAHALGLKVIFDMVIHGFSEKSLLPQQRPNMFVHNERGELARHPTWKSITTDWASPAYQQYMVDLVLHDQRTYGNDGYRVDAATFKGAGWNPAVPYPAYRDGSAAPELMRRMLAALRRKNPDAVLLSEVFGPIFYSVCNFAHDNQTEAIPFLLEKMQQHTYTAADYKQHILAVYALLPKGANRVFYARNHDTSWFYHFDGYTARFMAFEAVHALFGIPEVFAGDPNHPANPDDTPSVYGQYRRLFSLRRQFPEFVHGEVRLERVRCSSPHVFSGIRRLGKRSVLALISFSTTAQTATITLDSSLNRATGTLKLTDIQTGQSVTLSPTGHNVFKLRLKPFQGLAGRLN